MSLNLNRVEVPAGFSGWWCAHCSAPASGIPEDLDAHQAKCPKCRKWTAVWIPPAATPPAEPDAPVEIPRVRPHKARAKALFDHIFNVMENPTLNPDLDKAREEGQTE